MEASASLRRSVCGVALVVLLAIPAAPAPPGRGSVSQETAGGLHTARLETAQGSIQVYLPDAAASDTIYGTVSYTPAGETDVEREKNLAELRGYVVEVAEKPVADGPTWVRVLPDLPGPTIVRFRGPRGTPVGDVPIPTLPPSELPPPPTSFEIPTFGQAGNPVEIGGPFTGGPEGTRVTIGGQEAPFLARSPRKTIARVPSGVLGPTEIGVEQDGQIAKAPFRVLTIALSADSLHLKRGQRTALHLEVSGLAALSEPVPLTLTNRSPQTIRLGNTEVERLTISPQDVAPDGTYRIDRPIQSVRAGGFAVNAVTGPASTTRVPVETGRPDALPQIVFTVPDDLDGKIDALDEKDRGPVAEAAEKGLVEVADEADRRIAEINQEWKIVDGQSEDLGKKKWSEKVDGFRKRKKALEWVRDLAKLHRRCCTQKVAFVSRQVAEEQKIETGTTRVSHPVENQQRQLRFVLRVPVQLECKEEPSPSCLCIADLAASVGNARPQLVYGPNATNESQASPTEVTVQVEPLTAPCNGKTQMENLEVTYVATYTPREDFRRIAGTVEIVFTQKSQAFDCPDDQTEIRHTYRAKVESFKWVEPGQERPKPVVQDATIESTPSGPDSQQEER